MTVAPVCSGQVEMASGQSSIAKRLRGPSTAEVPAGSQPAVKNEEGGAEGSKEEQQRGKLTQALRGDAELASLDSALRDQALAACADDVSVIWAQVKGFPWWPVRPAQCSYLLPVRP